MKERCCYGREVLYASYTQSELTRDAIIEILNDVFPIHLKNRADVDYLENYYKGVQPILNKKKEVRETINNIVVENNAFGIIEFKKSYILGKPIKYVQIGETVSEEVSQLNKYMSMNDKHALDLEIGESLFISGIGHRIALPSAKNDSKKPFILYNLDSKNTFVVYERTIGNRPLLGVTYYAYKNDGKWFYRGSVYTENMYYEFEFYGLRVEEMKEGVPHVLGRIPIIEYHLNKSRLGLLEVAMSILNTLNNISSNDMDAIEQTVNSLLVFINQDIDKDTFKELVELGAVKVKSENPSLPADVKLLINNVSHEDTKVYYQRLYNNMLFILGLPRMEEKSSGGDTGQARRLGEGWTSADLRADQDELAFKMGERAILEIVLDICHTDSNSCIVNLEVDDVESKFERNKSDNLLVKAQALLNLHQSEVSPKSAMSVVGLWSDANAVCEESQKFYGEDWWKNKKEKSEDGNASTVEDDKS